ncbi:hypothetical protein [Nonomuraea sediminis]|uniref:hypothetical protein n=1 Tax=Nonomuraea sediminis TaxID=2835864 RepID=UPI001BDDC66E|nr:hypothetical protein [Nonomuraea sediminis]
MRSLLVALVLGMTTLVVALVVAAASLWGAASDDEGGRICLDRAERETALYLAAIDPVLPASDRASVDTWNGCDSANNGASLTVSLRSWLGAGKARVRFDQAGWSTALLKQCQCEGIHAAKRVGSRVIGVEFVDAARGGGNEIEVRAVDSCCDDNGYRCQ